MTFSVRTERTAELVARLHEIVAELEAMHPGRRFPLDGHLVGSLGEAAAEAMFRIRLQTASTAGHDAIAEDDGRTVEIKATYGNRAVSLRATSHDPSGAIIVLRLSKDRSVPHDVIYNGPLTPVATAVGRLQSNGASVISLTKLRQLNTMVPDPMRVATR